MREKKQVHLEERGLSSLISNERVQALNVEGVRVAMIPSNTNVQYYDK